MSSDNETVAIIGGTGRLGPAVALRLARAGRTVLIGSRQGARAHAAAVDLSSRLLDSAGSIDGDDNNSVVRAAATCIITVPAEAVSEVLPPLADSLHGRVLVSTVVPLAFSERHARFHPPVEGSAAQQIQALVPQARVTAALHTVSSAELIDPTRQLNADSLICGDDDLAVEYTAALVALLGLKPVRYGALRFAADIEALTPILLNLNRSNRGSHTGIHITGLM